MWMADRYILANRMFEAEIERGAVVSLKYRASSDSCEFILPGTLFGEIVLTYQTQNSDLKNWFCNKSAQYEETEEKKRGLCSEYTWSAKDDCGLLEVCCSISAGQNRLNHVYSIENRSAETVKVLDAALAMTPNSSFEWGDSAGKKVIGHPFIGGHGSHSVITRCDGNGEYLVIFPYSESNDGNGHIGKWELFDQGADLPIDEEEKKQRSRLYVYEYSEHETKKAQEHGYSPRIEPSSVDIAPGESVCVGLTYTWASDYADVHNKIAEFMMPDVITYPGYTVGRKTVVKMCVRGVEDVSLHPEFPESTVCNLVSEKNETRIYELEFDRLGENSVDIIYGSGQFMRTEFFVTQSVRTMIEKRGSFIASHQVRNANCWYNGLLTEWNNKTGVQLSPDNYDCIKGWRIYEVSCDDPGLSKPAFLSGKEAEYPVQEEVNALDYYIENFVWGGLQCTEEEKYPYGIYGIPDWHANRFSEDRGNSGREHLWRIYDYPHIALMYFNMYRIASDFDNITTLLTAREYLKRAYNTAAAMFTVPLELEEWSAYETGLYNELVITDIIEALEKEDMRCEAEHLRRHWQRKVRHFILKCKDLFGSEYPFDTTGFESTQALAKTGLELAEIKKHDDKFNPQITYADAVSFLENQIKCNIACRGCFEPTYFWYGSDYRGNNHHYVLSYMSQMGGWAILDYALHYAENPYPLLRLGYGSLLSSWALFNGGDESSNYGFFFPGKEHDGAASGGFEPLPYGKTWLEQPHSSGAWYYSCEIDLGFCGALRGASCIVAQDPVFGLITYGGELCETEDGYRVNVSDGIARRFHIVRPEGRLHVKIDKGHFADDSRININSDFGIIEMTVDTSDLRQESEIHIVVESDNNSEYEIELGDKRLGMDCSIPVSGDRLGIRIVRIK